MADYMVQQLMFLTAYCIGRVYVPFGSYFVQLPKALLFHFRVEELALSSFTITLIIYDLFWRICITLWLIYIYGKYKIMWGSQGSFHKWYIMDCLIMSTNQRQSYWQCSFIEVPVGIVIWSDPLVSSKLVTHHPSWYQCICIRVWGETNIFKKRT